MVLEVRVRNNNVEKVHETTKKKVMKDSPIKRIKTKTIL